MNALAQIPPGWRRRLVGAGVVVLLCALSGAGGAWLRPRKVVVTEYKDRVQVVEHQVVVEKPVVQWRDRDVVRIVYRKDGSKQSETTVREDSGKATGGSTTTTDTNVVETHDLHQSVTTAPEGRWAVRVLAGLDTGGSVVAGAGVDYRLLGPATVGLEVLAPVAGAPGRFTFLVTAGMRFP